MHNYGFEMNILALDLRFQHSLQKVTKIDAHQEFADETLYVEFELSRYELSFSNALLGAIWECDTSPEKQIS